MDLHAVTKQLDDTLATFDQLDSKTCYVPPETTRPSEPPNPSHPPTEPMPKKSFAEVAEGIFPQPMGSATPLMEASKCPSTAA